MQQPDCHPPALEPDPEPDPLPPPERRFTGNVVLVLGERVPPRRTDDLLEHAGDNVDTLERLRGYLVSNSSPRTTPVVTSVGVDDLLRAEEEARGSEFPPLESLTRYWLVDATGIGKDPQAVADELLGLDDGIDVDARSIAHAYPETTVDQPGRPIGIAAQASAQGWLRGGKEGVNAWWAWDRLGGDGAGIGVIDVEQGWNLDHRDITGLSGAPLCHVNRFDDDPAEGDHGASVLGLLAGRANSVGGAGIAFGAGPVRVCSHWDGASDARVVDAIVVARQELNPGDVLLLEVQRPGDGYRPVETDDAVYHAIRLASAKKVIVVEAAGNGRADISGWKSPLGRTLSRDARDLDSGAVVVAAGKPAVETDSAVTGHRWNDDVDSNYGRRVDCYAWGSAVQAPHGSAYGEFGGTSAAAAIIAAVAAVTQGMRVAAGLPLLTPLEMRDVLSDRAGTRQVPVASTRFIGVMPDLEVVGTRIGAVERPVIG